jgi:hypothetical protein
VSAIIVELLILKRLQLACATLIILLSDALPLFKLTYC